MVGEMGWSVGIPLRLVVRSVAVASLRSDANRPTDQGRECGEQIKQEVNT